MKILEATGSELLRIFYGTTGIRYHYLRFKMNIRRLLRDRCLRLGLRSAALSLAMLSGGAAAQDQGCQESIVIGDLSSVGSTDFKVRGDLVYIASALSGFAVVDISDRTNPEVIGFAESSLILNRVSLSGDAAVVKTRDSGILLFDISVASSPELVGHIESGRGHSGILVNGNVLYAGRGGVGIDVFDISDLTAPSLVTTFDDGSFSGQMELAGNELYIAAGQSGLVILDVTDPIHPVFLSQLDITEDQTIVIGLNVDQGLAVLNLVDGVALVDVQDPQNPALLSFLPDVPDVSVAESVAVEGDRVYLSYVRDGVFVFDVSDHFDPVLIGKYSGLDGVFSMDFEGDQGFVSLLSNGFQIIDFSNPSLVDPIRTEIDFVGQPRSTGVLADQETLLVSDWVDGLYLIDVSDPTSLEIVSELDFDGDEAGFDVVGDFVFISAGEVGMHIVYMPDRNTASLIATIDTPGEAVDVEVAGGYAYVSDKLGGVQIVDANVFAPEIVGSYQTPMRVTDVVVEDELAFVNDTDYGVYILDVSVPSQPVLVGQVGSVGGSSTTKIALHDDVLYVGLGWTTVKMYDVTDPANPFTVNSHYFWNGTASAIVFNDTMYFGGQSIYAVDVSGPANIEQLWRVDAGWATGMSILGDYLLAADEGGIGSGGLGGVIAIDLNECQAFCLPDLNRDQELNFFDVAYFLVGYVEEDPEVDFNEDGAVNFFDVSEFIVAFQAGCP